MAAAPPSDSSALMNSAYADELRRGSPARWHSPSLKTEFTRLRLREGRTVIRLALAFGLLVTVLRGTERAFAGGWHADLPLQLGLILAISGVLGVIVFTRHFERLYVPVASVLLPVRGLVTTAAIAGAVAQGRDEMLMLLPLMVIGPFFFLGLPFRAALVTSATIVASFVVAAIIFQVETPIAVRSAVLMIASAVICAMAAGHVEKRSRENFLQQRLIAQWAEQDALTGTKNRRMLDEHLTRLWQRGVEDGRTLAVLLIDVDHFKAYNDRYGHQAGDAALRRVAQAMQEFVTHPFHVLARYGGEEFAAILYDCDAEQALRIADGMRRAVRDLCIEHRESKIWPAVTLSIGVAAVKPAHDRNPRGLLRLADRALYKAKARGRNRVEWLDEEEIVSDTPDTDPGPDVNDPGERRCSQG